MNFLAHAFLAGAEDALVVGGVVGDWIKGPLPGGLPGDLARGVALHRAIDGHAETHPAFRASRRRLSPDRRRWSGVLVDIFYDHLLARDWSVFHTTPLADYTAHVYARIDRRLAELPAAARPALELMASEDWLVSYASLAGIADVLARMGRRARQPNPLGGGEAELAASLDAFAADFRHWLKDAQTFAGLWATAMASPDGLVAGLGVAVSGSGDTGAAAGRDRGPPAAPAPAAARTRGG